MCVCVCVCVAGALCKYTAYVNMGVRACTYISRSCCPWAYWLTHWLWFYCSSALSVVCLWGFELCAGVPYFLFSFCLFVCLWRNSPQRAMESSFTRFLYHTQRRVAVCRTPLDEWSARRKDFCLTTHNTHNRHPYFRWDSHWDRHFAFTGTS
jgi:hypothetical protein